MLENDATAGAVVPMLLNPDGTIQEAGSVIDSVGWPLAFGRGESADAFAHRFRREVDYGSAACVLIRRHDFAEAGGFEPAYGIGYFEDVDLSFKLKERGLRTISGLDMLIAQAALAFELFFLHPAPREHDAELWELLTR